MGVASLANALREGLPLDELCHVAQLRRAARRMPPLSTGACSPVAVETCTAERLGQLNAESAACIATWQVAVRHSQELGRFLVSGTGVPAGHTVLVLPPNRILRFEHVDDFNTVIQVRASESQAGRLYSASLTPDDLDNFLSHSCEPLCQLQVVEPELTVRLVALRDVPPGVPVSIDYEALEEDMVAQGVDFDCACGTPACRGRIVGSRRRTPCV